jgi:AcrR family transcriptional regulator
MYRQHLPPSPYFNGRSCDLLFKSINIKNSSCAKKFWAITRVAGDLFWPWYFNQVIWYIYQMAIKINLPSMAALPADASARVRILTAGVEVLHSEGFASLTQQAVAAKAGVRQSHVTYYFPTRLDLLQATAHFGCESMMQPISNAAIGGVLSFEEFRELLLPDYTDRGWWRLMTALVNACEESQSIRNWIVQFDAQLRERLRHGFRAYEIHLSDFDIEFLHAAYIGAITLDMQELTEASNNRAKEIVAMAIDMIVAKARQEQFSAQTLVRNEAAPTAVGTNNKAARPRIAHPPPRPTARKALAPKRRVAMTTLKDKKR